MEIRTRSQKDLRDRNAKHRDWRLNHSTAKKTRAWQKGRGMSSKKVRVNFSEDRTVLQPTSDAASAQRLRLALPKSRPAKAMPDRQAGNVNGWTCFKAIQPRHRPNDFNFPALRSMNFQMIHYGIAHEEMKHATAPHVAIILITS